MEKRTLGKTGMEVSVLGLGAAEIGLENVPQDIVETLLNSALDAGLNVVDTAECYADSEEKIGKTVGHRRNDFFLFTKCGHASGIDLPDWDPRLLEQSIERSLKRLQTDCVDLLQLHSCSEEMLRKGDVIAAVQKARDAGKARFIGYSGDREAALYAVQCGAFDTLQTSINIADQQSIDLTLPLAKQNNIGVIAKRPVANVAWAHKTRPDNTYVVAYWERLQKLNYDFLNQEINAALGEALRFTLGQPGVHTAIVGTSKPGRWKSNAALLDVGPMSREEINAIRTRWSQVVESDWVGRE